MAEKRNAWDTRNIIVYLLCAAVFIAPIHDMLFYVPLLGAVVLSTYRIVRFGNEWRCGSLWRPGLLFLVCSLISTHFAIDWRFSLFNWCFLPLMYAVLYVLLVSYMETEEDRRGFLRGLFLSFLCVLFYGIFQFLDMSDMAGEAAAQGWIDAKRFPLLYRRMYSSLGNPNLYAGYLLVAIGMMTPFFLFTKRRVVRVGLALFGLAAVLCLLLTYSRGAWVAFFAMLAMLATLYDKRIWLIFLAVPVILFFYQGQLTERFLSIFSGEDTSTALRFALWEVTVAMIQEHLLTGIGWGIYFATYPWYNFYIQDPTVLIYHAHNMYLSVTAEVGIPGAIGFFWFYFGHAVLALRLYRTSGEPFSRAVGLGLFLGIVGLSVYGLGDHVLFSRALSLVFWSLCALGMACFIYEKKGNGGFASCVSANRKSGDAKK